MTKMVGLHVWSSLSLMTITVVGVVVYNYWPDDSESGVKRE